MHADDKSPDSDPGQLIKGCLSDEEIDKTASLLRAVWPHGAFISKE